MSLLKEKIKESKTENNSPLKTEEIISILNKADKKKFLKKEDISAKILSSFKKFTLTEIAKKSEKKEVENKLSEKNSIENESNENKNNTLENVINNAKKNDDADKESKENKPQPPLKIYTKEETQKIANDLARKYYERGYQQGIKKIKEDLQEGENSIAITLKNTIDNLFFTAPDLLKKLNSNINKTILEIASLVVGYEIERVPEKFLKRINSLVDSIGDSTNKVDLTLNPDDYKIIKNFLQNNKTSANININFEENLNRGDLVLKSGGIEIEDIFSEKVNMTLDESFETQSSEVKNKKSTSTT